MQLPCIGFSMDAQPWECGGVGVGAAPPRVFCPTRPTSGDFPRQAAHVAQERVQARRSGAVKDNDFCARWIRLRTWDQLAARPWRGRHPHPRIGPAVRVPAQQSPCLGRHSMHRGGQPRYGVCCAGRRAQASPLLRPAGAALVAPLVTTQPMPPSATRTRSSVKVLIRRVCSMRHQGAQLRPTGPTAHHAPALAPRSPSALVQAPTHIVFFFSRSWPCRGWWCVGGGGRCCGPRGTRSCWTA